MSGEMLKMIESVDPNDTAKLDEIDLRVCAYVTGWKVIDGGWIGETGRGDMQQPPEYTRSRDALKSIRPEGWIYSCHRNWEHDPDYPEKKNSRLKDYRATLQLLAINPLHDYCVACHHAPTEELAELHAIIQAIQHGRIKG